MQGNITNIITTVITTRMQQRSIYHTNTSDEVINLYSNFLKFESLTATISNAVFELWWYVILYIQV